MQLRQLPPCARRSPEQLPTRFLDRRIEQSSLVCKVVHPSSQRRDVHRADGANLGLSVSLLPLSRDVGDCFNTARRSASPSREGIGQRHAVWSGSSQGSYG